MIGELLDKLVSTVSPGAGLRRGYAREGLKLLSTYAAADRGRRTRDWKANDGSADLAIIPDARLMNARARQLVRDSWVARSATHCASRNIIGRGITPVPVARDVGGKELTAFNRRAEKLFWEWANDPNLCDIERRQTFWAKQALVIKEWVTVGEHFVVWSYVPGTRGVGLRFQSMESDQLYDIIQSYQPPQGYEISQGNLLYQGNQVRGGIEIDAQAAPVAYHFWTRNPNDYLFRTNYYPVRVPKDRCFHLFTQGRTRQTRGETMFAPVMQDIRDLADYRSAHLWRARMEACIGAVIKTNIAPPTGAGAGPLSMPRAPGDPGTTPSGLPTFDFVPGMTPILRNGEEIEFHNPQSAGNNFDPFTMTVLRGIAAGMDISYEQLARDFSKGSYSSQRQGLLEDRRSWRQPQDMVTDVFVAPMYRLFIQCAFLEGKFEDIIPTAEYLMSPGRFYEAEYIPDGQEWIDPLKEVKAAELAIELRLKTRKEYITAGGGRLRNTLEGIADEKRLSEELKIPFPENDPVAALPLDQDKVVPPGGDADSAPPPAAKSRSTKGNAPAGDDDDTGTIDADDLDFDEDFEPDFDNETTTETDEPFKPLLAPPIGVAGKGFGAPSDTFGPNDVFDNPQHNPEAAVGGGGY